MITDLESMREALGFGKFERCVFEEYADRYGSKIVFVAGCAYYIDDVGDYMVLLPGSNKSPSRTWLFAPAARNRRIKSDGDGARTRALREAWPDGCWAINTINLDDNGIGRLAAPIELQTPAEVIEYFAALYRMGVL